MEAAAAGSHGAPSSAEGHPVGLTQTLRISGDFLIQIICLLLPPSILQSLYLRIITTPGCCHDSCHNTDTFFPLPQSCPAMLTSPMCPAGISEQHVGPHMGTRSRRAALRAPQSRPGGSGSPYTTLGYTFSCHHLQMDGTEKGGICLQVVQGWEESPSD